MNRTAYRRVLIVFVVLLLICFISIRMSVVAHAEDRNADRYVKCYTSVQVHENDTLDSIAEQYCDRGMYSSLDEYKKEIRRINNLGNGEVHIGHYISVPYYQVTEASL